MHLPRGQNRVFSEISMLEAIPRSHISPLFPVLGARVHMQPGLCDVTVRRQTPTAGVTRDTAGMDSNGLVI